MRLRITYGHCLPIIPLIFFLIACWACLYLPFKVADLNYQLRLAKSTIIFLEEVGGHTFSNPEPWNEIRIGATLKDNAFKSSFPSTLVSNPTRKRVIVVVPFSPNQADAVKFTLEQRWSKFPPCDQTMGAVADLVFFTSKESALQAVREDNFHHPCFQRIEYLLSTIPKKLDQYLYAPPYMFFELMLGTDPDHPNQHHPIIHEDNDFMFLMEPDVWPVKDNWLDLIGLDMRSHNFWIRGSRDRCPRPKDGERDNNINGNAFYKLHDGNFINFLSVIKAHYSFTQYKNQTMEAYDYAFNHYLLHLEPSVYRKNVISMLEVTSVIYNHPHYPYREEFLPLNAALVHNKGHIMPFRKVTYKKWYAVAIGVVGLIGVGYIVFGEKHRKSNLV